LKECPEGRPISLRFFKNRFFRVHDLRPARFMTGCGKGFIYQNRMTAGKKQGATGITTVAPYVAGQWGRGDNRLHVLRARAGVVPVGQNFFLSGQNFSAHG
jgi:hypothetical protein